MDPTKAESFEGFPSGGEDRPSRRDVRHALVMLPTVFNVKVPEECLPQQTCGEVAPSVSRVCPEQLDRRHSTPDVERDDQYRTNGFVVVAVVVLVVRTLRDKYVMPVVLHAALKVLVRHAVVDPPKTRRDPIDHRQRGSAATLHGFDGPRRPIGRYRFWFSGGAE